MSKKTPHRRQPKPPALTPEQLQARFPNMNLGAAQAVAATLKPQERFSQERFAEAQAEYIAYNALLHPTLSGLQIAEIVVAAQTDEQRQNLTALFNRTVSTMVAGWREGRAAWPRLSMDDEVVTLATGGVVAIDASEVAEAPKSSPPAKPARAPDKAEAPELKVATSRQAVPPNRGTETATAAATQPDLLGATLAPGADLLFTGFAGRVFKTGSSAVTKFFGAVERGEPRSTLHQMALLIQRDSSAVAAMATVDPKDQRYFNQALVLS